jgi:hypothetical protein
MYRKCNPNSLYPYASAALVLLGGIRYEIVFGPLFIMITNTRLPEIKMFVLEKIIAQKII